MGEIIVPDEFAEQAKMVVNGCLRGEQIEPGEKDLEDEIYFLDKELRFSNMVFFLPVVMFVLAILTMLPAVKSEENSAALAAVSVLFMLLGAGCIFTCKGVLDKRKRLNELKTRRG
jgi:hypothetical protein